MKNQKEQLEIDLSQIQSQQTQVLEEHASSRKFKQHKGLEERIAVLQSENQESIQKIDADTEFNHRESLFTEQIDVLKNQIEHLK